MVLVGSNCLQGLLGVINMKERVFLKQGTPAKGETGAQREAGVGEEMYLNWTVESSESCFFFLETATAAEQIHQLSD